MKCAVRIDTDLEVTKIQAEEGESMLEFCYRAIGCQTIEVVHPKGLADGLVMVVDEEFLLVDKPVINFVGSFLYGTQNHRSPICGNVLIMREVKDENGADLAFLDEPDASLLAAKMEESCMPAYMILEPILTKAGVLRRV